MARRRDLDHARRDINPLQLANAVLLQVGKHAAAPASCVQHLAAGAAERRDELLQHAEVERCLERRVGEQLCVLLRDSVIEGRGRRGCVRGVHRRDHMYDVGHRESVPA